METDLPSDYLLNKCLPRLGKATVEKITINAVMAGALPTYLPLLIAGVKGLKESGYFRGMGVSAGSWAPCYLVNGPIRRESHANRARGVMSPGDIANAAIGHAMGLIVKYNERKSVLISARKGEIRQRKTLFRQSHKVP